MNALLSYIKAFVIALITIAFSLLVILAMLIAGKKIFYPFARLWSRLLLAVSGVRVESIDKRNEKEPSSNFVFAANHSSFYDIPIILASCGTNANIVYKKSLEDVPVWGWGLRMSPFIAVDRSKGRDAMAAMEKAIETIRKGDSIIIFPEGTRTKTGELGPFKRGAFMMAARSGLPIVPVAIQGSYPLLQFKPFRINRARVQITYNHPLSVESEGAQAEKEAMEKVRNKISEELDKK